MTSRIPLALALGASLAAAGAAYAGEPDALADKRWQLTELAGEAFTPKPTGGTEIVFRSNGKLAGYAFCNSLFSSYTSESGQLAIKPIGVTMRACVDPADNDREQVFLKALRDARGWRVEGDRLTLLDGAGTVLLRFAAAP